MSCNSSAKVVKNFLDAMSKGTLADEYLDPNIEYVSLNQSNPELAEILPWTGTRHGPVEFKRVFGQILDAWDFLEFQVEIIFDQDEKVAVVGRFAYESKIVKKVTRSPFAIYAKVREAKIYYFQFFEDTYSTASSFRRSGRWSVETALGSRIVGN